MGTAEETLARRQFLHAGVAGAALLAMPSACEPAPPGSIGADPRDAGRLDAHTRADAARDGSAHASSDAGARDAPPDATLAPESGSCVQTDSTRPINIAAAGIAAQGTSVAFFDDRYLDPVCSGSRILLIHPKTREAYVALSGVCTHLCCEVTGGEGGPTYRATFTLPDGGVLDDVVHCTCHGALFSALDGSVLSGPGGNPLATGLEVLSSCEGAGFIFVSIPARSS